MALPHPGGAKRQDAVALQAWYTCPQAHAGLGVHSAW